jgi:hypothetical protein
MTASIAENCHLTHMSTNNRWNALAHQRKHVDQDILCIPHFFRIRSVPCTHAVRSATPLPAQSRLRRPRATTLHHAPPPLLRYSTTATHASFRSHSHARTHARMHTWPVMPRHSPRSANADSCASPPHTTTRSDHFSVPDSGATTSRVSGGPRTTRKQGSRGRRARPTDRTGRLVAARWRERGADVQSLQCVRVGVPVFL